MASDSSCGSFENPLLNGSRISQCENEAGPIGNDPDRVATWMLNGSNIYDECKVNLIRVNFELRALKKEARFFQREMHYTYARMQMHFVRWQRIHCPIYRNCFQAWKFASCCCKTYVAMPSVLCWCRLYCARERVSSKFALCAQSRPLVSQCFLWTIQRSSHGLRRR